VSDKKTYRYFPAGLQLLSPLFNQYQVVLLDSNLAIWLIVKHITIEPRLGHVVNVKCFVDFCKLCSIDC